MRWPEPPAFIPGRKDRRVKQWKRLKTQWAVKSRKNEYRRAAGKVVPTLPGETKLVSSLREAIEKTGLKDGMTISFHHHFREGDYVLNMVLDEIAKMGIKNLKLAASSIANVHEPLIEHIKNGVITEITSSGLRDKVGSAISHGLMEKPVVIRSHGGRARAIESGEIHIWSITPTPPSASPKLWWIMLWWWTRSAIPTELPRAQPALLPTPRSF